MECELRKAGLGPQLPRGSPFPGVQKLSLLHPPPAPPPHSRSSGLTGGLHLSLQDVIDAPVPVGKQLCEGRSGVNLGLGPGPGRETTGPLLLTCARRIASCSSSSKVKVTEAGAEEGLDAGAAVGQGAAGAVVRVSAARGGGGGRVAGLGLGWNPEKGASIKGPPQPDPRTTCGSRGPTLPGSAPPPARPRPRPSLS